MATLEWVHWYNEKRLYVALGYISPAKAERNFYNTELSAKTTAE
jgi:transposase InsO family protein